LGGRNRGSTRLSPTLEQNMPWGGLTSMNSRTRERMTLDRLGSLGHKVKEMRSLIVILGPFPNRKVWGRGEISDSGEGKQIQTPHNPLVSNWVALRNVVIDEDQEAWLYAHQWCHLCGVEWCIRLFCGIFVSVWSLWLRTKLLEGWIMSYISVPVIVAWMEKY
jgi:hypothetical protein